MEPIRILNLFTIMNRAGAETIVMNYYRNIDRSKVQFDFLVHREEKGDYDDEIEELGGKIYRTMPIYPQNFASYKKFLRQFFRDHKEYKIVHSHMSELGYFAFKEAKKEGVPVIICHAHNAPKGFDSKMIIRNYFKHKMRAYITDMFTCGIQAGDWLFGKRNQNQVIMMNNAIDSQQFSWNKQIRDQIRSELGLGDKFVIAHVGRFDKQKNHTFLIDIFKEVYRLNSNSELVLVGEGVLQDEIKNKVKEYKLERCVKFLGVKGNVHEIMQAADVFLFPSLFEGLGVVLIEAQAAGLQVFTSKDRVSNQARITELLHYFSLEESPEDWAKKVLTYTDGYVRKDMTEEIKKVGYDIIENSRWLEKFYIDKYRENCEIS